MTDSNNQEGPKAEVESVLAEFDAKKDILTSFCDTTKSLIEEFLRDAKIRYQSVQARVKTRDKLRRKYLDQTKSYGRLDDITDQAALRVITYYEDEVDKVAEVMKREFDIDSKNSIDKRETEPDKFGYYALSYVCKYPSRRIAAVEYKKFSDVCCEIQITSILRHAWSEIEHPWYDLKDAFPDDIKRRFARMAALLEIAESEFLSLRKIQSDYKQSVAVQVGANVPDVPVDAVSLRSFIEQEPLVSEIDKLLAAALGYGSLEDLTDTIAEARTRAATLVGLTRLQDVRDSLDRYKAAIPEYARRCKQEIWPQAPAGSQIYRGVCIYHLGQILANLRGAPATVEFLKAFHAKAPWDIARQVAIAKEITAKYSS